jgi:hypothetical protein
MKKVTIQDLMRFKFPSTLKKNSTGTKIAFMLHEMNEEDNDYLSNLWIMDSEMESYRPYTTDGKTGAFYWEDEKTILFKSGRQKDDIQQKVAKQNLPLQYL